MRGMNPDTSLIEELGGPTKVAELLGYDKAGGPQRVHNWTKRGIPAAVKVARPDLFLKAHPGAPAIGTPPANDSQSAEAA